VKAEDDENNRLARSGLAKELAWRWSTVVVAENV
jgi:hypothetical protein